MKKMALFAFLSAALIATLITTGIGCRHEFPYVAPTPWVYQCSANITRDIPVCFRCSPQKITEQWQFYAFTSDPQTYCGGGINHYITHYMAPGFTWNVENDTAVPITGKQYATDCPTVVIDPDQPYQSVIPPPTYGAPFGAELRWNDPPGTEASVSIWLEDKDGVVRTANPKVKAASADFAERTGLPDRETLTYIAGKRHIRFSDLSLELDTPFGFGPNLTVTKFYIQSIGTILAEEDSPHHYTIYSPQAKFYVYGSWNYSGQAGITSFCCVNQIRLSVVESQESPASSFSINLNLGGDVLGENMTVIVSLSKPMSLTPSFQATQPSVSLSDQMVADDFANLSADVFDEYNDIDPARLLWFEDFDVAGREVLLGVGNPLRSGPFGPGQHRITLVAYNKKGAYNSGSMVLTRVPFEHFGIYRGGSWYMDMNNNGYWDDCLEDRCIPSFGGARGDRPVVGNWLGSRHETVKKIGLFRGGVWYLDINENNVFDWPGDSAIGFGTAGDIPVVGDWNGDGFTEIGVFRNGVWYLDMNGNGAFDWPGDSAIGFGMAGDIPVVGDWNGDGYAEIGVFRNGVWYLDTNGNGVFEWPGDSAIGFGMAEDIPVVGDWNGDGYTEIGVFRNGVWYLDTNGNGVFEWPGDFVFVFGQAGDKPVIGEW